MMTPLSRAFLNRGVARERLNALDLAPRKQLMRGDRRIACGGKVRLSYRAVDASGSRTLVRSS